jgi:hypothetical protein
MFDIYSRWFRPLLQMNGSDGMESDESDGSGSEWEYEETYTLTGTLPAAFQLKFHPSLLYFFNFK